MNEWSEAYEVTVSSPSFTIDGMTAPLSLSQDCIDDRICPDTENSKPAGNSAGSTKIPPPMGRKN